MITLDESTRWFKETKTKGEPPMPEKKQRKPRGVVFAVPSEIATDIAVVAEEFGIQRSKVRELVQEFALKKINEVGVRGIVAEYFRPLLADLDK